MKKLYVSQSLIDVESRKELLDQAEILQYDKKSTISYARRRSTLRRSVSRAVGSSWMKILNVHKTY